MAIESKIMDEEKVINASVCIKETEYGKEYDYIGEGELRVTITLAEYRELVSENAELKEKCRALREFIDDKKASARDNF